MSKMKMILSLAVLCLVLNNGLGAPPPTGRYMFLRCNPSLGNANCVKHQSPEMELSPDLPARLPAAAADYIEAEPVKEDEEQATEPEEGSGGFEGSSDGYYPWMADRASEPEPGSGGSLTVNEPNRDVFGRAAMPASMPAAQELREENLLL